MDRIIGEFTEGKEGPLIFCIGGIHGNELAGIKALDLVLKMLEVEHITNPGFSFRGKYIAIRGNLNAIQKGLRYIDRDLNRNFTDDRIGALQNGEIPLESSEDKEALEIIDLVKSEIAKTKPSLVIIMDLHTTSSSGGIFTIISDDEESIKIAREMHAPVIKGMLEGIRGTTLHYFNDENLGIPTRSITFESGQHEDPLAINIAIAGIIACMRAIDCVDRDDVESLHDDILINFSKNLPEYSRLISKHNIQNGDGFTMKPGYENFQSVKKGEIVAMDNKGPISISEDGILLMPLYQTQGEDGFFLIKNINENEHN